MRREYSTISVRREVKEKLEKYRRGVDWSDFLESLMEEALRARREAAFRELRKRVLPHLASVEESRRRFREEFSLRGR